MDNLLDKVKRLLGGGQQPRFITDIGNAVGKGYNTVVNTKFMPNQRMTIGQATQKATQNLTQDFGNTLRGTHNLFGRQKQNPIIPKVPILGNLAKMAGNTGETIATGAGGVLRGGQNIAKGIVNKNPMQIGQGVVNAGFGAAQIASVNPATSYGKFFQIGNVLSQSGGSLTQRIGKGMMQGQTGINTLAPNVKEKQMNIAGLKIDPVVGAASLVGFTRNPAWAKVFGETSKLAQFGTKGVALKGGLEGLLQGMDQLPDNPSTQDIQKILLTNIAFGMGAEVGANKASQIFKQIDGSKLVQAIKKDISKHFSSIDVVTARGIMPRWKAMFLQAMGQDIYTHPKTMRFDNSIELPKELTPEQIAAKKKLPGIMYSTSKTKAEGIPSVTPKSDLLKKASDLERIGREIQYQNSLEKDAINQQIAQLTSDDLKNLSSLRKMVNSRAGQEGDIETLYSKNKYLVNKVLDRMREITRDYELNTNRSDEDLLNIALSLPSKSKARIPKPTELKLASELRKQAQKVNDIVYNAEPKLNIQTPEQKASQDYKEWSDLLFRQTVKNEKQSTEKLVNSIGDTIESNTQKLLQQKYAIHSKSGNILVDKAGNPLDADIMRMAESWKDKPRLSYSRETIDRNFEDIMGKDAPEMKARYIEPVKAQEANRIRWLNNERKQISSLGIKARSQDSALVQKLGEGKIDYQDLYMEVKGDKSRADKIIKAVDFFKSKYKQYLKDINNVLEKNGYDPIPERKDYFTHFQEVTNVLEQIGIPQRDTSLPTDVNGLTADFKPGKNFFSSALPRLTDVTDFDAIQGIDRYIDGASKQIFHTNNIQSLRLLEKSIRHKFAGTTKLTNFVADLTEYTNNLAGKKSMIDRAAESLVGRTIYAGANRLKRQVGANMVGANVASALTNYIPLTQSLATTNKGSFVKGMMQTISSVFKNDGFVERSDFLTRRLGSDRLSINLWDKIGEKAGWLFKAVDNFTSQVIVRSKFDEGIAKGLSPARAMQYADDWAARIMADRSLGSMPTLFNSQTLGLLTQFQLEVNNQLSFMAKDIPRSFNKVGAASALGQVFLYSYLFNNLFENIVGRRPAFDPIGIIQQSTEDYNNPNISSQQATKNTIGRISDSLPFTSVFTGGRLPIGSAIPDPFSVVGGKSTIGKEAKKLTYLLPPLGGGQAQKTFSGIQAYNRGQSETDSGAVRYPIEQNAVNRLRTTFFGQYSTPEARKYFREGEKPLGDQQSSVLKQSQDKKSIYQQFIDKRNADSKITQASEQMKQDGSTSRQVGNTILLLQSDGKINKIDLNFQPKEPKLTGNTELDKKLISKYKGEVTRKANDILALYEAGKMTADEAEKAISELKTLSTKFSKPKVKKPKKVSLRIKKAPKVRTIKIKMAKLPKIKKAKRPKVLVSSPKLRLKIT